VGDKHRNRFISYVVYLVRETRDFEGLEKSMREIKVIFLKSSAQMGFSPPFIRLCGIFVLSLFCLFLVF
jgi:hypothetical protein